MIDYFVSTYNYAVAHPYMIAVAIVMAVYVAWKFSERYLIADTDYEDNLYERRQAQASAGEQAVEVHFARQATPAEWREPAPAQSKFKKHRLNCDTCDGPLTILDNQLAVCEFCKSQYYLEGYEVKKEWPTQDDYDDWARTPYWRDSSPYWVDGGVSLRAISQPFYVWK